MEDQVASAIEIAGNPSSDQALKTQAFEYVNQLRTNPAGWQVCFAIFTKSPRASDLVRHVALEIVSSATQSGLANTEGLNFIKDNLMEYLRQIYGPNSANAPDPVNIQNKIAQTITFLFCALYSDVWTSFFDDMLSLAYPSPQTIPEGNPLGIIFYLRVLNSVHEEIGDVLVSRPPAEQEKANMLKDLIRHRDVQKLVNSWQEILAQWQGQNDLISQICLKAIGNYVSWIDISLVVNQSMLDLLFQQLAKVKDPTLSGESEKARDVAIDVFTEIVGKKMKPSDKINMIVFLDLESIVSHLTASPLLQDYRFTSKYDTDLAETLSKLVNITTIDIVKILNNDTIDNETRQKAETLLQAFLRHILRYFSDEYDEVCSTIIPSMSDLLAYFRKMAQRNPEITSQQAHMLLPILKAIVQKMRYDDSSSWGNEEEVVDEAEFQELRKRLGNLQQMVAATNQPLYIGAITEIVQTTLERVRQPGTTVDWRDLNLALHEMYLLGELAVRGNSLYTKSKPNNLAAERLIEMINVMVESDITTFAHPATQLQSMEICVRYSSFFEHHPHLISNVLANFLQLVHHPMIKVKTRSWYLFYRFVKHLRNRMENVAETVISALGDLLPIHAEIEQEGDGADDMSSEDREGSADAIFTQQLYLFEAIGCICSISSIPPASQALYVRSAMTPLFMEMESNLSAAKSNDERAILQIHHDIMALGTLAKGFADVNLGSSIEGSPPEVSEVFGQAAEANLVALEALNFSINIRTAARFAFSRLIGIQGSQILPQFPKWIDGLLTPNTTKDELALFLRLQDQVIFGFKTEMYGILDTLLTPFLQHVFAGFTDPVKGTDDEIQLAELKREYLNFLNIILSNDLGAVIISSANQPIFESLIGTVERFATDVEDLPTAKMAFSVLSRMSSLWGGADVAPAPNHPTPVTPQPDALPGFAQFMITRFSPLCWALPMTASFNSKDAQAKQALGEAAVLQKTIYMKTGAEYSEWLRHTELPGIGMGEPLIDEYLGTLERLDVKAFRQFFQSFIQRLSA